MTHQSRLFMNRMNEIGEKVGLKKVSEFLKGDEFVDKVSKQT